MLKNKFNNKLKIVKIKKLCIFFDKIIDYVNQYKTQIRSKA